MTRCWMQCRICSLTVWTWWLFWAKIERGSTAASKCRICLLTSLITGMSQSIASRFLWRRWICYFRRSLPAVRRPIPYFKFWRKWGIKESVSWVLKLVRVVTLWDCAFWQICCICWGCLITISFLISLSWYFWKTLTHMKISQLKVTVATTTRIYTTKRQADSMRKSQATAVHRVDH